MRGVEEKRGSLKRAYAEREANEEALCALAVSLERTGRARVYINGERVSCGEDLASPCPSCSAPVKAVGGMLLNAVDGFMLAPRHERAGDPHYQDERIMETARAWNALPVMFGGVPCALCGAPLGVAVVISPGA
jgi:hypothetical protein